MAKRSFRNDQGTGSSRPHEDEVIDLVLAYARQETVTPLRGAGRWILWGLVSMSFISIGLVLIVLGLLRAIQDLSSEVFDGSWSFVPYGIGVVLCAFVVGVGLAMIRRPRL